VRIRLLIVLATLAGIFAVVPLPAADANVGVTVANNSDLCLYPLNAPPGLCITLPDSLPLP
jgi:hypothetical protein